MTGLHDFELLDRLGESCMTEVWKAYQPTLQRTVMVKFLRPEFLSSPAEVEVFTREAKIVARLSHPNIVGIYNAVETSESCFIVLEHVAGPSVMEMLAAQTNISVQRAIAIATDVSTAMDYAWEGHGLIHRNLTPKAILIDSDNTTKLAYLGHSMRVNVIQPDQLYAPEEIVGTPNYMSPEQASGSEQLDCRSDIYALGVTLYHMLTGTVPFAGLTPHEAVAAQQKGYLTPPRKLNPELKPATVRVLERMLMRDPAHRHQSWGAVSADLAKVGHGHIIIRKGGTVPDCAIIPPANGHRSTVLAGSGGRKVIIHRRAKTETARKPAAKRKIIIRRSRG